MFFLSILALAQAAPAATQCQPHYTAPIEAVWLPDGRSMRLTKPTSFVDQSCQDWPVPAGAVVDGASIPSALWSVGAGPFEGRYRNASVIHDWYCDRRNRKWQDVHRVFYNAMIASGVSTVVAKTMYSMVYLWGPRWTEQAVLNNRISDQKAWIANQGLDPGLKAIADTASREAPEAANRPSTRVGGRRFGARIPVIGVAVENSAVRAANVSAQAQTYLDKQIATNPDMSLDQIDRLAEQVRYLTPPEPDEASFDAPSVMADPQTSPK